MRATRIWVSVAVVSAAVVIVAPAYGALIRWTPEKVEAKLKADSPIAVGSEIGHDVLDADCKGLGKGLRGKYVRFECEVRYGGSNGFNLLYVRLRVQQIGSGKLCISAIRIPGYQTWRVPPDVVITSLFRPEKVCTS